MKGLRRMAIDRPPRVGWLLLGLVGSMLIGPRWFERQPVRAEPAAVFAAHALGTLVVDADLTSAPAGGPGMARLAAGTPVRIGGLVRTPGGLGLGAALWISPGDGMPARYGFVSAESVLVTAGEAPVLELAGVDLGRLLTPREAVSAGEATGATTGRQAARAAGNSAFTAADGASFTPLTLPWLPPAVARWSDLLTAAGRRHGVDPALLAIVVLVESGGNPRALSPAGAMGLMQVMPATGADIARQRGIAPFDVAQLRDPAVNVDFGAWYLARQLAAFGVADDGDWQRSVTLAAAAYNGGPGTVQRHLSSGAALPAETARYQRWVGGLWRERHDAVPATLATWLAAGGQVLVDAADEGSVTN